MPARVDDPTIADDELLWRRILPAWLHRNPDGSVRPASMAFLDGYTGDVSVHLASQTTPHKALEGRDDESLAEIITRLPRSLGHSVVRDPTPEDASHALVCPPSGQSLKQRKSDARTMARAARWVMLRDNQHPT